MIVQTFCTFGLIYLALCALFTWVVDRKKNTAEVDA